MPQYRIDVRAPGSGWVYASTCFSASEALRHIVYARQRHPFLSARSTKATEDATQAWLFGDAPVLKAVEPPHAL